MTWYATVSIAKDDAFAGSDTKHGSLRLALKNDMNRKHFIGNQKLRALLSTTKGGEINKIHPSIGKFFSNCTYMRAFDISKTVFYLPVKGLLNQISSLQHSTYINLSNTNPLIQVPPSLEKLKDLQILGFRPARTGQAQGCRIAELRRLTQLTKLELQLTCGEQILDEEVNVLVYLQNLQILTVNCFDNRGTDLVMKLEKLLPPKQLHQLCLRYYPGEISPTWLNPVSLPMLRYLTISSGNLTKMHRSFWSGNGTVWKIEGLLLESLSYLDEKWVVVQQAMPSLKTACVRWCPELESSPVDAGFKGGVWKKEEHRN
ncbi:hypothetical protein RJ641_025311 [Dillenia turbinata]|uniref:Disease resistance R13L4/SHOC-2-like LRR domain-containing protein n=1 Tax=Dillenia turbinata TaxID=194707 RepID=A0AAN8W6N6_9MAGN